MSLYIFIYIFYRFDNFVTVVHIIFFILFRIMMNRLLVRRFSMSSIEEEDESEIFDETITETEKLLPTSLLQEQFNHTPSICEWDSELSESEQEFDDNNENLKENSEEQAANRALQCFKQSFIKTVSLFLFTKIYRGLVSAYLSEGNLLLR